MAFFLPILKQLGYLDEISMMLVNVGSRKITTEDDYGSQNWGAFAPNLTIIGFDADPEACEAANAAFEAQGQDWNEFHIPIAIAKEVGKATLHITKNPMCSSLYPPNEELIQRFPRFPDLVGLASTVEIETTTLDQFCQDEAIEEVDFLQVDVQGANLQVLQGARALLQRSVFAIQTEVEFSPIYRDEPLFAETDTFLRQQGFTLFDLSPLCREQRSPLHSIKRPGQLLWSDAIYLRDPLQASTPEAFKTPEAIFKLACIADALEFTDYALELLEHLTLTFGQQNPAYNLADAIVQSLAQVPDLLKQGLDNVPVVQKVQPYLQQPIPVLSPEPILEEVVYAPPVQAFQSEHYLRHNQRRLEHLASLGLPLQGRSVLEVGAGIGDHTSFFLDRGCDVVTTEGRADNFEILQQRFPQLQSYLLDCDHPDMTFDRTFDVVYCYGLLYHLQDPVTALQFMAKHCGDLLLLETAVSTDTDELLNPCEEPAASKTQSIHGLGCRPSRSWVYQQLKQHFPFVYLPTTQPSHEEFPIDWTLDYSHQRFTRAVFIASRNPLDNPRLIENIPMQQTR